MPDLRRLMGERRRRPRPLARARVGGPAGGADPARARRPVVVTTEHNEWTSHRRPTRVLNGLTAPLDAHHWAVSDQVRSTVWPSRRDGYEVLIHGIDTEAVVPARSFATRFELTSGSPTTRSCRSRWRTCAGTRTTPTCCGPRGSPWTPNRGSGSPPSGRGPWPGGRRPARGARPRRPVPPAGVPARRPRPHGRRRRVHPGLGPRRVAGGGHGGVRRRAAGGRDGSGGRPPAGRGRA